MIKNKLFTLVALLIAFGAQSQIVINEFVPADGRVELKNIGDAAVNVSAYELCSFPLYTAIGDMTLESGMLMLQPGAILVVSGHTPNNLADDELGLYINGTSFGNQNNIVDYVEWGSTGHTRSGTAVMAGIWETGDFIAAPEAGLSVSWDGTSNAPSSWSNSASTFGEENFGDCAAAGGVISTTDPTSICAADGVADVITVTAIDVVGTNSLFVITDEAGNLIDSQTENVFDFDEADSGICLIWHLSYEDDVDLNVVNANELAGCFSLSNPLMVTRTITDAGTVSISGGATSTTVVVNDGAADEITFENDSDSDADYMYIITDENDMILGTTEETNDFEGNEAGECHVWGVSYSGTLTAEVGQNISTVSSDECFEVTETFVTVVRDIVDGVFALTNSELSVFPTVIENQLNITGLNENVNLAIYSAAGKLIWNQRVSEPVVQLPLLTAGLYVAKITSGKVNKSFRLIKK